MIKIENIVLPSHTQMVAVARGMRNSYNSWDKMDTQYLNTDSVFGPADLELAKKLVKAGPSDAKFMRMIQVIFDVTAPLYWWKEMDTYKIGTVRNSCSTMHKIMSKPFEASDFSIDVIGSPDSHIGLSIDGSPVTFNNYLEFLNESRNSYLEAKDPEVKRKIWIFVIQLLSESYNQKSTMSTNYAVLSNIYHQRKNHKLTEWHRFCDWIETLPMSELITGEEK